MPTSDKSSADRTPFDLGGRVAVVTGASRGIGAALAAALARAGASLALIGRDAAALADTSATIAAAGGRTMHVAADVGDAAGVDAAFQRILDSLARIDILINNAGICLLYTSPSPRDCS